MKIRHIRPAIAGATVALAIAGCGSGSGNNGQPAQVKTDGTFTLAINSDPGNLDPQAVFTAVNRQMAYFLYDTLVNQQGGKIASGLASAWTEGGTKVTFTLHRDATCSDGSPLTARDVAANISYVADPKNKSALLGIAVPPGTTATADDAAAQVTVTTPKPTGFLLQSLSFLPIVCAKATADRTLLTHGADGSGPYTLTEAVPGDHYALQRRAGYKWGPAGATTETAGLPGKVVVKVVSNETTAANLLLTGGLNAATVSGPDRSRLEAAKLFSRPLGVIWGEFLYNEAPGRVGNSEVIRRGLTQALDLNQLRKVSTAGAGSAPKQLLGESPCRQDSVTGSLPAQDISAAKSALQPLSGKTLTLVYLSKLGPDVAAAAELAVAQWKAVGVTVQARGMSDTDLVDAVYKTGNWDIAWLPADGQIPSQIQSTFSGPTTAQGGNNFAAIHNDAYDQLSASAAQQLGDAGCADWTKADQALMQHADVVPFSVANYPVWGAHATFDTIFGDVAATSIRVLQ